MEFLSDKQYSKKNGIDNHGPDNQSGESLHEVGHLVIPHSKAWYQKQSSDILGQENHRDQF